MAASSPDLIETDITASPRLLSSRWMKSSTGPSIIAQPSQEGAWSSSSGTDGSTRTHGPCHDPQSSSSASTSQRMSCASPDSVVDTPSAGAVETTGTDDSSWDAFHDTDHRSVHFADDMGMSLIQVHEWDTVENAVSRIVVLLLSPDDRTFEFLHAEYPADDHTTVQVLLEQLPTLATNQVFKTPNRVFTALTRTRNNVALDNNTALSRCELEESELVLGVLEGYSVPEIAAFAVPLLVNGKITKAVNRARRTGRGLKYVKSGEEWREVNTLCGGKEEERKMQAEIAHANTDETAVETADSANDREDSRTCNQAEDEKAVFEESEDKNRYSNDLGASQKSADAVEFEVEETHGADETRVFNCEVQARPIDPLHPRSQSDAPQIGERKEETINVMDDVDDAARVFDTPKAFSEDKSRTDSASIGPRKTCNTLHDPSTEKLVQPQVGAIVQVKVGEALQGNDAVTSAPMTTEEEGLAEEPTIGDSNEDKSQTSEVDIDEQIGQKSEDESESSDDLAMPDLDDEKESDSKYPELRDYIGGDEGAEKVVLFIHAISVAAVGFLAAYS